MYKHIKNILDKALSENVILEIPKDSKMGHFSTPIALILSKKQKQNPQDLANELIKKLKNIKEFQIIQQINGFINITLSDDFLAESAKIALQNPQNFAKQKNNKKILLEFVSANPTGPLHIGHARGAIFGDTLGKIGRHLGYEIINEYYINDAGSQIEMLGYSIFLIGREILELPKIKDSQTKEYYKGDYINNLTLLAVEKFGKDIFLNEDSIKILADFGLNEMLGVIKNNLNSVNIKFDNFISERTLSNELSNILEKLEKNNAIYKKDEKIWLKSSTKGDEKDRVIIRNSKEPTYLAGDIIYHNNKFMRNYDYYINIWGADHHGYIARVKAAIDFLGYDSSKLKVILSQMVSLLKSGRPYKMSKRAGNFILMQEIVDDIGKDALRFVFISKKADTHLEFDIDILKKEDSNNPIYYINYANARIHTILEKSTIKESNNFEFSNLDSNWKELLVYSLLLEKILENSFNEYALQKLPEYLKNLASKLHFCYNSSKILNHPQEASIINILKVVSLSITTGLNLMGIIAKTKM